MQRQSCPETIEFEGKTYNLLQYACSYGKNLRIDLTPTRIGNLLYSMLKDSEPNYSFASDTNNFVIEIEEEQQPDSYLLLGEYKEVEA